MSETEDAHLRRVSHDLMNLLGVILGNAELALMDLGSDHPVADCLQEIQNSGREARALCRQISEGDAGSPPRSAGDSTPQKTRRFLVIDDNDTARLLFERTLRRLGHEVRVYASAPEALELFESIRSDIDFVITDMNMPGTDGLEVAAEFLRRAPETRICIASGEVNDSLREAARRAGISHFLRKPGTTEEFQEFVQTLFEAAELKDASRKSNPP